MRKKTDATEAKVTNSGPIEDKLTQKRMRLEERFNARITGRMLIADLRDVLGDNVADRIPLSDRFELIQGINYRSFDKFCRNLQDYKHKI